MEMYKREREHIKESEKSSHMSKMNSIRDNRENGGIVKIMLEHVPKFMKEQFQIERLNSSQEG